MRVKELTEFTFENYFTRIGFIKENSYYSMKHSKNDLLLLPTKLIKKYLILVMQKSTINHFRKTKIKSWLKDQQELFNNQKL